ncbi:hypothetical protein Hanom_Chr15g01351131 [Helianthus anomalus]
MQIMVKREISYIIIHKQALSLFYTVPMKCYELMMLGCLKWIRICLQLSKAL